MTPIIEILLPGLIVFLFPLLFAQQNSGMHLETLIDEESVTAALCTSLVADTSFLRPLLSPSLHSILLLINSLAIY